MATIDIGTMRKHTELELLAARERVQYLEGRMSVLTELLQKLAAAQHEAATSETDE